MSTLQQQFHELIKNFKGKELEKIIERILDSELYITSEFLNCPNIQALKAWNKYFDTLHLFSILTYSDYKKSPSKYFTLNPKLLNKLKCVSILEAAKEKKYLEYSYLKNSFDIKTNFELEELLFNLISKELINGKVNAQNESLSILSVKPRCPRCILNDIKIVEKLNDRFIDNLNNANEFLSQEENKIKCQHCNNNSMKWLRILKGKN